MISEELRQSIARNNQSHILKYYDEGKLSEAERASFEDQVPVLAIIHAVGNEDRFRPPDEDLRYVCYSNSFVKW